MQYFLVNQKRHGMVDYIKPFNFINFLDTSGRLVVRGLLVTKNCCPFIPKLHVGVVYVVFSSTVEHGEEVKQFIHVYMLESLVDLVRNQRLGGITDADIVASHHNPWTPLPNETRKKMRQRKKMLSATLYKVMCDYVLNQEENLCKRCAHYSKCCGRGHNHTILWQQMGLNGKVGFITSGFSLVNIPYNENHRFNGDLVRELCKKLHMN